MSHDRYKMSAGPHGASADLGAEAWVGRGAGTVRRTSFEDGEGDEYPRLGVSFSSATIQGADRLQTREGSECRGAWDGYDGDNSFRRPYKHCIIA